MRKRVCVLISLYHSAVLYYSSHKHFSTLKCHGRQKGERNDGAVRDKERQVFKMKRKTALFASLLAAFALVAGLMVGCGGNSDEPADANGTTFTVGFDQNFPPFGYMGENGEFTGFDLDLAAEVCERNGWTVKYEPINWDAKDAMLNQGSITCIWNGFTMEGREDGYTFTDPYLLNGQVVVVRADSGIKTLDDLAGKTVMTQIDSAGLELISAGGEWEELGQSFGRLDTIPDYNTAMMNLEQGSCDAVIIDLLVANYQIAGKEATFTILDQPLSSEHYGVGFKVGNTKMAEIVESTLREMYADGTVAELAAKYDIDMKNWLLK